MFESSALSSRNYRVYLFGNLFSVFGVWVQRLAIGWHAWELSGSSFVVGLLAAAQFLPMLVLTPIFGVLADRIAPRSGAIALNAAMFVIATVLGVVTLLDWVSIELLFLLALLHGIASSAYSPIRMSLVPDLVPRELFASAVAISSMAFNTARFAGPGMAGYIVSIYGLGWAYVANALSYLPVIGSLASLDVALDPTKSARAFGSYREQMLQGLRYTRGHPRIRAALLLVAVVALFGRSIVELLPAFAAIVYAGDADTLAILMSATGAGAVVASGLFTLQAVRSRIQLVLLGGAAFNAAALAVFSQASTLIVGVVAIALVGFAISLVSIASQADIQLRVEHGLRGRVLSLWTLLSLGGPALGSIAAGALARFTSPTTTTLVFALASVLAVLLVVFERQRRLLLRRRAGD